LPEQPQLSIRTIARQLTYRAEALRDPRLAVSALALTAAGLLATCSPERSLLEEIQQRGSVRMATVNSATTYYLAAAGPTGFEYDLGKAFAERLGVELEVVLAPNRQETVELVLDRRADFAAGLGVTEARDRRVRFTPSYADVIPQVVWRSGGDKPEKLTDLDGKLVLPAHSSVAERFRLQHPGIAFEANENASEEALLFRVARAEIAYTIADSNLVKLNQRYHPELRVAFDLGQPERLAWAFSPRTPGSLFNKAVAFINDITGSEHMQVIRDRHYGHVDRLGFVGGKTFARVVEERLPKWRDAFKTAGEKYAVDWRLLAAIGYQESHWDPTATSPTGVRGLMMLTNRTARELGIRNRLNPQQSIDGGARYFAAIRERLPASIKEPDRTWMALAAYNIGMGHLMATRRLLKKYERNPNRWVEVRDALPWLTQEKYYRQTRYGYARGHEAVAYVGNIRAYYDILRWMTSDEDMDMPEALTKDRAKPPPEEKALGIDAPVL